MRARLFVDVTDPWSYVGTTRFERAAATFTIVRGEPVDMALRAFQLDPDVPSSGRPLRDALAAGHGEHEADEMLAQVSAAARISGIDLNFHDAVEASSFDAWRLLTWAGDVGAAEQRDLAHQLWRAHLLEGADVSDPFVLATRAALVGLDLETAEALLASDEYADQVRLQVEAGRAVNVTQLPTVVVEDRWTLAGLHSQDDYVQALDAIYREWREA